MRQGYVLVEGQTEETFVREVLAAHLEPQGLHLTAVIAATKRVKAGGKFRGGVVKYSPVKKDLQRLLSNSSAAVITTMLDYYRLPGDFPGMDTLAGVTGAANRVAHLEEALEADLGNPRFHGYLSLHEFEALLLADPDTIRSSLTGIHKPAALLTLSGAPEEINDGDDTHPAARIKAVAPTYRKALDGPPIAKRIGLAKILDRCPHFAAWVHRLENLAT